jgi:asparagine synthase (glutamine-hydrolysing)
MCGIAGIYNRFGLVGDMAQWLEKMLARIQYRGPDESGIYINSRLAMGSVRLSIIDLQTGSQPISSSDGKDWIVYNGEIFNYIELKTELSRLGFSFRTESDTEVLLNAYLAYGTDCLNRLNGQFAFAIWNNEKEELFMARDRMGIRPLFYTWVRDTLVFGSEIKTLFEHPDVRAEIDPVSLSQVFTLWTTIPPATIFKNIFELPPGNYLKVSRGQQQIRSFWTLRFPPEQETGFKGSLEDASAELLYLLKDAVRIRLRADVPVAAYLSGGLDSSATTALIKRLEPETLQTFSIGFTEGEFDETPYQSEVSKYLNTKHTGFLCTLDDIGEYFPQVVWHAEIPLLRTAPVPMYCLSKKVRDKQIKVVITGEGADEMLAGYDIFKEAIIREFWSRQPESKLRPLLLNRLYPYLAQFQGKNKALLKLFYGYKLSDTDSPFYSHLLRWHNNSSLLNYLTPDLRTVLNGYNCLEDIETRLPGDFSKYSRLSKAQWLEIGLFMSGYLLSSQGDRVSMANSVEGRYPFLDYRVIEFAAALPPKFKMSGLNEKYILKKMMQGNLPESVLKRPKQAYRSPVAGGFFSTAGLKYINDLLSEKNIDRCGLFRYASVEKLIGKVRSSPMVTEVENMALSGIISTQLLVHQYVFRDSYRPAFHVLKNCRICKEENVLYR